MPETPVRLSLYNKINSVMRSNQYKKELEAIRSRWPEQYIRKELSSLAKRWGLPHIMFCPVTGKVSYSSEDNAVEVIPYKSRNDRVYIAEKAECITDEEFSSIPVVYVGSGKKKTMYIDRSPRLESKRYLTLRIDLDEKKGVLIKQFEEKINFYKKYSKQSKGRQGETVYDPWEVYDMYQEQPSFSWIAKKLSGKEGNTTHNSELDAARKAVERAYDVAKKGILNVEEETQDRVKA